MYLGNLHFFTASLTQFKENKMNNEEALKQLGIEIPEGYEFVRHGIPTKDDYFIGREGTAKLSRGTNTFKYTILKEKIETECWYLVEDDEGDINVMHLNDKKRWCAYLSPKFPTKDFSYCKIISKMEAVK